jgi:hypothetical protein
LEIVLISIEDRCTVGAKHATGSKIVSGTPDGLLGDMGQVEARFSLFGDSVSLGAR